MRYYLRYIERTSEAEATTCSLWLRGRSSSLATFFSHFAENPQPVHDAWLATLHMVAEVLWHLIQFAITASTEECYT